LLGPHHLADRCLQRLIENARNPEVGDLHPTGRSDEKVSRFDLTVHGPGGVCCLQDRRGLRGRVKHAIRGERGFPLENRGQCLTRHELHDEVYGVLLLAVDVYGGDALMIDEGGIPRLCPEALEEAWCADEFAFNNCDRDPATDDWI
jgi:hypothetical protein